MAEVTVKSVTYGQWGNAVEISNGSVELVASLDFGPRILRFGFVGGENVFFEDTDRRIEEKGDSFKKYGENAAWRIYGGHRLWTSPETSPRTYYPDNDPVKWEKVEGGVILRPDEERWTQTQKEIEIRLAADKNEVTVLHRITNTGAWPVQFAPWALSVMAAGGKVVVPHATRETGYLPNKIISLWPYSKMNDKRVYWGEKFIVLHQGPGETPFKFGSNDEAGWAAYHNNGTLFIKYYNPVLDGNYPDYGVSFESYTCDHFIEVETLGELRTVQPQETVTHREVWNLFQGVELPERDEAAIERELGKFLKK